MIAGHYEIPEVCVFFGNKLFRGEFGGGSPILNFIF